MGCDQGIAMRNIEVHPGSEHVRYHGADLFPRGMHRVYKREQWSEALTSFSSIADSLGSTTYGRLSRLYAARAARRAGEAPRAVELYRSYLAAPAESVAVEQLARLDLGIALQKTGDKP